MNTQNNQSASTEFRAERYETQELASIEVYGRMGKLTGRMKNLSLTGAFFEIIRSDYFPQKGDLLRITIPLRQVNRTHVVDGEIIWTQGMGFGVSFLKHEDVMMRMMNRDTQQRQV